MTDEKHEQRRPAGKQRPGEAEQRQAQEDRDSREGGGEAARKEQDREAREHGRETRQGKNREDMTEAERQHEAEQAFKDAPPGYSPTARIGD
jgi:hypothetical protein